MNEEQTKKLIEAAPLLYRDANNKIRGRPFAYYTFECSSGWYNLLMDLSVALEKEIQKQPDLRVVCNIPKYSFKNFIRYLNWIGECIVYLFYFIGKAIYNYIYWPLKKGYKIKLFWSPPYQPRVNGELVDGVIYEAEDIRLRAVQVKSKFASLRYYTDGLETRKIRKLIDQAESKSHTVCELCGNDGRLRDGGWMETLCDPCYISRENNKLMRDVLE